MRTITADSKIVVAFVLNSSDADNPPSSSFSGIGVLTRSKSKLNQNLYINIDENSKRTVSVLLTTPERNPNTKYNCPPPPRAPTPIKRKLSDNAKNVARRLDFSNMKNEIELMLRNWFGQKNSFYEQKVTLLYNRFLIIKSSS